MGYKLEITHLILHLLSFLSKTFFLKGFYSILSDFKPLTCAVKGYVVANQNVYFLVALCYSLPLLAKLRKRASGLPLVPFDYFGKLMDCRQSEIYFAVWCKVSYLYSMKHNIMC